MIRPRPPITGPRIGPGCGGCSGCSCALVLALPLAFVLGLVAAYFLGFSEVGPTVEAGRYSVRTAEGTIRTETIGTQPAERFDVKVSKVEAVPGATNLVFDVIFSEAEVNSKVLELLEDLRRERPNLGVHSTLMVLHPGEATAFVNGDLWGRDAGVEVQVEFVIDTMGQIDIDVQSVRIGDLPSIPFGGAIANALVDSSGLESRLEEQFPTRLTAVRIEEGRLVVEVTASDAAEAAADGSLDQLIEDSLPDLE